MSTMLTSEEATISLKEAAKIFPTIDCKPTDNDITAIIETLTPILKDIKYNPVENTHNLWGVIAANGTYTSKYGVYFAIPPKLSLTDKTIASDTTEATIQDNVAEHAARKMTATYTTPPKKAALPSSRPPFMRYGIRSLRTP